MHCQDAGADIRFLQWGPVLGVQDFYKAFGKNYKGPEGVTASSGSEFSRIL